MNKKIVSGIMLILLLMVMLTLALNIQPVKASGTIYIRYDGSVDPPTAPIQRDGGIYTFTGNIYDEIVVERDNIVVDGAGYTIQGTGSGIGINLTTRSNVTVKNVEVTDFYMGISLDSSSNNVLSDNNSSDNTFGILLSYSSNNALTSNTASGNANGIVIQYSSNNTLTGNTASNNFVGIVLSSSNNNVLFHNSIINNPYNQAGITTGYANTWDDGYPSGGNYWSDHVCTGNPSDGSQPYTIDENNIDHYPFQDPNGWLLPPTISILSPENKTYSVEDVPLTFTVSESTSWIGYSLDEQANVTITGNRTLSGLSDGSHSIIVYAKDTAGNTGASEIIYFTIETEKEEAFPTWIIGVVAVVVIGTAIAAIFLWRRRK